MKKKRRRMTPLSKLSLILVIICVFIPILILSITRGFQYFSLEKLSNFYDSYFITTTRLYDKKEFTSLKNSSTTSYYQDFLLLKKGNKETPSLLRAIDFPAIKSLQNQQKIIFLRGKNQKLEQGEIIVSESLALDLGVDIGSSLEVFLFLPHNSFPMRKAIFSVAGIISFQNALLDRSISLISPLSLEKGLFIEHTKVNTFASPSKEELANLFPHSKVSSLQDMPSVKQMKQQYFLLLLLALASSCLCFFALFMNLKTNLKDHLYSLQVCRILGLPEEIFIRSFLLQNFILVSFGILIGVVLSVVIVPHIAFIVTAVQNILNTGIIFLRSHFLAFRDFTLLNFLPPEVFYIREIPVKMALGDFLYLSLFLFVGIFLLQFLYKKGWQRESLVETLKKEQGV